MLSQLARECLLYHGLDPDAEIAPLVWEWGLRIHHHVCLDAGRWRSVPCAVWTTDKLVEYMAVNRIGQEIPPPC